MLHLLVDSALFSHLSFKVKHLHSYSGLFDKSLYLCERMFNAFKEKV